MGRGVEVWLGVEIWGVLRAADSGFCVAKAGGLWLILNPAYGFGWSEAGWLVETEAMLRI
ncbi:MAG: hypothetical protein NTW74_09005 [Acidobacteria bacterium]|nr:hypothetical protein [Acidobacteriota bacterium]